MHFYHTGYGVPDPKVAPKFPKVKIKSIKVKDFPLIGDVVDIRWKGEDFGLRLIESLNGVSSLLKPMMKSGDLEIRVYPKHECWVLTTRNEGPTTQLWDCYQAIARQLLAASRIYQENR